MPITGREDWEVATESPCTYPIQCILKVHLKAYNFVWDACIKYTLKERVSTSGDKVPRLLTWFVSRSLNFGLPRCSAAPVYNGINWYKNLTIIVIESVRRPSSQRTLLIYHRMHSIGLNQLSKFEGDLSKIKLSLTLKHSSRRSLSGALTVPICL